MYRYILCIVICALAWIINGGMILRGARQGITAEIYTHTGLGIFFTLLGLELTLGATGLWTRGGMYWLRTIGLILYIPSAFLVFGSIIQLRDKGNSGNAPASLAPYGPGAVVQSGIYGVVRHPMWLGMAIWTVALILSFQSIPSLILGVVAVVCFRMGAVKEDEFNVKKFGDPYREYMQKLPLWNFLGGLRK